MKLYSNNLTLINKRLVFTGIAFSQVKGTVWNFKGIALPMKRRKTIG
jgi:hypothetical protein